ncbi:hypothetical protein Xen7305DRAFT_00018430 [Xenococcus sp. PCC 7305]|uniref:hypothetical protein n=1 Tax=Xenococcus sp. PCC 7305 TaxID=102125 RepID=UPI0002AC5E1A|nr:hypothetical protein [Xenococcus sp. PCC 7305]ELS02132.1 hypothetical protein Xen7305DRAFT_00018430 [Xenococcus sp. PCC 7305]
MHKFDLSNRFYYQGQYPCPVCRHGQVTAMPLMEAFACDFCQHIFTTNFDKQLIKMADSQLPLTWYWNGNQWQGIQGEGTNLSWGYLLSGAAFVTFPTVIVALGAYIFPTAPNSPLSWLPLLWTILTPLTHLLIVLWLVVEYYQLPLLLYLNALRRRISLD